MATPNGLNPTFGGRVGAQGFATLHNKGIGCVVVDTNSTTAVDVFGTTNGFTGTITGVFVNALGGTGNTITLKGSNGATIATVVESSTAGLLVGPTSALANTAIDLTGTCTVVSNANNAANPNGQVFVFYKVTL